MRYPALMLTALLAAVAACAGCQAHATLRENRAGQDGSAGRRHFTQTAVFGIGDKGRQTVVLAFEPMKTPSQPPADATSGPAIGQAQPTPSKYRFYLMLVVQEGGGDFQIGQRVLGGQVRAVFRVFDENGRHNDTFERSGTISTTVWPLLGGPEPADWWVSGRFDVLMTNDLHLTGRFVARPSPVLVDRFIKEKRL